MTITRVLVGLVVALWTFGAGADEGVIGADDRVPTVPDHWPLTAVGRLNIQTGGFCSATLIRPDRILAAGHCVNGFANKPQAARQLHFLAGYHEGRFLSFYEGRTVFPGSKHARPDVSTGNPFPDRQNDWATVVVQPRGAREGDQRPAAVYDGALEPLVGQTVMLAGYHHDKPSHLLVQTNCHILGVTPQPDIFLHDCDLKGRASGSPIFTLVNGTMMIVGIAVAYTIGPDGPIGLGVQVPAGMIDDP